MHIDALVPGKLVTIVGFRSEDTDDEGWNEDEHEGGVAVSDVQRVVNEMAQSQALVGQPLLVSACAPPFFAGYFLLDGRKFLLDTRKLELSSISRGYASFLMIPEVWNKRHPWTKNLSAAEILDPENHPPDTGARLLEVLRARVKSTEPREMETTQVSDDTLPDLPFTLEEEEEA